MTVDQKVLLERFSFPILKDLSPLKIIYLYLVLRKFVSYEL